MVALSTSKTETTAPPIRGRSSFFAALVLGLASTALGQLNITTEQQKKKVEGVGVDQRLGNELPLETTFRNAKGKRVSLGDYFEDGRPVLLNFVYLRCPQLCGYTLDGTVQLIRDLPLTLGADYQVVTISFNPREGPSLASKKKRTHLKEAEAAVADGWAFLTGEKASIQKVTEAVGFRYKWLPDEERYSHKAVQIAVAPSGKISRYLPAIAPKADTTRLALVDASGGEVGSIMDQAILLCCQFDPEAGSYVASATTTMYFFASAWACLLAAMVGGFWLFERRRRRRARASEEHPSSAAVATRPS